MTRPLRRYPLAPLLAFLPPVEEAGGDGVRVRSSVVQLAQAVATRRGGDVSMPGLERTIYRAKAEGATERQADEWACALGLVAENVWADYLEGAA